MPRTCSSGRWAGVIFYNLILLWARRRVCFLQCDFQVRFQCQKVVVQWFRCDLGIQLNTLLFNANLALLRFSTCLHRLETLSIFYAKLPSIPFYAKPAMNHILCEQFSERHYPLCCVSLERITPTHTGPPHPFFFLDQNRTT